jgi:hypothetical protein
MYLQIPWVVCILYTTCTCHPVGVCIWYSTLYCTCYPVGGVCLEHCSFRVGGTYLVRTPPYCILYLSGGVYPVHHSVLYLSSFRMVCHVHCACILLTTLSCICHPWNGVYPVHHSLLYLSPRGRGLFRSHYYSLLYLISCEWCVSCTPVCTVPIFCG